MKRYLLIFVFFVAACSGSDEAARVETSTTRAARATTTSVAATTTTTVAPDVALARELERIERALRADDRPESALATLGRDQDAAYASLRAHPEWEATVVASLPPDIAAIATSNLGAASELSPLTEPRTEFPPWTIRAPLPRAELLALYREAGEASGVPWPYLASIHFIESRLGRIVGPSTAGAQGPMQFIPSSWEAFGEGGDIYSDRDSIMAAGRYLRDAGAEFDIDGALFAYNHSDHYVAAVKAYAELILADERAYDGYYYWPVRYRTVDGVFILPEGYPEVPAEPAP